MTSAKLSFVVLLAALAAAAGCGRRSPPILLRDVPVRQATPEAPEPGIPQRVPWATSRVTGSPDPPPPYRTERVFPQLQFEHPLLLTTAPGSDRLFVAEQSGRLFSFRNDPQCDAADVFLDLREEITTLKEGESLGNVYGLAFHPDYEHNRYCYISYVLAGQGRGKQQPDGSRVSRFRVREGDPPRVDPASEQVLFTWLGGGHNGGCLKFGTDGYLYVATGDGWFPNPPDARLAGQDVSNLLSAILRIDVDHAEGDRPYAVPADNPFVKLPGARPEIWAYGFRNPWKISFDRETGELWAGDVGWERFEMIHRVERGGNYGWSVMEGTQPVRAETPPGPTPIVPPAIELPHSEAASITGGYVYRGKRHPDLVGAYVFGDWETRRMWAARFQDGKLASLRELVEPTLRIVAFCELHDGELLLVDYDAGTIHQFAKNEAVDQPNKFPRRLSETGLFESVKRQTPAPGVVPFSINAEQWADFATAERWIALPGTSSVVWHPEDVPIPGTIMKRRLEFPKDAVLVKTLALEMRRGEAESRRRMETQLLHFDGRNWRPYAYRWNEEGTDAVLVAPEGEDAVVTVADPSAPGGKREQTWHFAGRAECARCHNPWAQHTLAFNLPQLARDQDYGHTVADQLAALQNVGILRSAEGAAASPLPLPLPEQRLVDPYDESKDVDARARSYLAANCAHCHQMGAGGTADIELRRQFAIEETKTLGVRPLQGTFGIHDAHLLSPGDPFRSVLYYRMSKLGRGRMPMIGSQIIDERGLALIDRWIRQLPVRTDLQATLRELRSLDDAMALAREQSEFASTLERLARQNARQQGREEITAEDRQAAEAQAEREAEARLAERAAARQQTIDRLLDTTGGALALARAVRAGELPEGVRGEVIARATDGRPMQIRDLFEPFLPPEQRAKRLGSVVHPAEVLALAGDADRGRRWYFESAGATCRKCHRIGAEGGHVGPDLAEVSGRLNRAQLLESILEPSKRIDPKFLTYLVETSTGRVHVGLLVEHTDSEVVLRDAQDREVRVPAGEVEQLRPQNRSLMPELLLRDMTAAEAADLLAFLESLRPDALDPKEEARRAVRQ